MRLVDKPHLRPHACAVVPFIGQSSETARWVDSGVDWDRDRIYLSDHGVRAAMDCLGFPSPEQHETATQELALARARLEEVEAELAEAKAFIQALDVIESADFRARKKRGPKPASEKPKDEVAA